MLIDIFYKNNHIFATTNEASSKRVASLEAKTTITNFATTNKNLAKRKLFMLNSKSVDCYLDLKSKILRCVNCYTAATLIYSNITSQYGVFGKFKIKLAILNAVLFNKDYINY